MKWEDAKYHEDPSYENFKVLLDQPIDDAKVRTRVIMPFVVHYARAIPHASLLHLQAG